MSWGLNVRGAARRLIGASLAVVAVFASTVTPADAAPQASIGVLVPIIATAGDGQLLSVDDLTAKTAADGAWTALTELAFDKHLTLAVDTRILASIAALGNDIPAEVAAWRDTVVANDPILLPWGNADVWAYSTWASNPFSAEQFAELASVDASNLTIWPSGRVVPSDSIATSIRRGFTHMLAFDDQFAGGINRTASTLLADAVAPDSSADITRAVAEIRGLLPDGGSVALPANPDVLDVSRAVTLVSALVTPTTRPSPVMPLYISSTLSPRTVVDAPDELADLMTEFAKDEERAATITDDVQALLVTRLRSLTAVMSKLGSDSFSGAVDDFVSDEHWLSDLVSISLATEYTVLSNTAEVPVSVSNASGAAVTVTVRVRSTSGIVQVDSSPQTITIDPQSNARIIVPMTAVANGRTVLVAQLFADKHPLGASVAFPIVVQAQWEIVTVIIFFGSVSIIMTIGIFRTIRRRRAAA